MALVLRDGDLCTLEGQHSAGIRVRKAAASGVGSGTQFAKNDILHVLEIGVGRWDGIG